MPGGTFAALRFRNFRLMWISLLVSNSGTWMQGVAQDMLVYDLTGRALDLGYVAVVRAVALISLSFIGGTIADRLDRRKLLIATQTLFAVVAISLGLLVQFKLIQVWHVIVASFFSAVLLALDQPARQSLLPHLVPRGYLLNAIALNSITFTGAAAVGPALAGPVVAALGTPWGFFLNGFSFLAVIWAVWSLRLTIPPRSGKTERVSEAVLSGLRYIAAAPTILLLVSILTVFSLTAIPYQSLLPVFARKIFDGGIQELGWLRAAPGIGALVGGLLLATFSSFRQKGLLVVGGGIGFAMVLVLFSRTGSISLGLPFLFLAGLFLTTFQSTTQTLMQTLTPDHMRGRVMSLFAVSVIGMWPLGSLPLSWSADRFGVGVTVMTGALVAGSYALAVGIFGKRHLEWKPPTA